uniref:aspartate/glutamate racemase family protein n=1 Tax=Nocardia neocaledoniensis TaxID=236511 RepID=UPI002454E017
MRIRVINPNTTRAMTATIERCALAVAGPGTVLDAVTSEMGPASIESHYDEAMSVPGLLAAIRRGEAEGVDGYVIACFGDPGLDAATEQAPGPVIGIAEAALNTPTPPRPRQNRGSTRGPTRGPAPPPA